MWCILLEERSQCPWISFTGPTELKSSSPLLCPIYDWIVPKYDSILPKYNGTGVVLRRPCKKRCIFSVFRVVTNIAPFLLLFHMINPQSKAKHFCNGPSFPMVLVFKTFFFLLFAIFVLKSRFNCPFWGQ